MSINNMKPGYQGKKDSMRDFAEKMAKPAGHAPDTIYSKSCADKARMRIYKEGGMVEKDEEYEKKKDKYMQSNHHIEKMKKEISKDEEKENNAYKKGGSVKKCDKPKFAAGGVAKYRHDQMTLDGKQKGTKKDPYTNHY